MTVIESPPPGKGASPGGGATPAAVPQPAKPQRPRRGRARLAVATVVLSLSACLLGFSAWMTVGSRLYYDRVQHDVYASFRAELAQATAPTGPTDPTNPKKLLPFGTPVAVLSIPEIGVHAVVLQGTTSAVLEGGPGHLRDTAMPGQVGISEIMGRRASYGGPFARISSLSPGAIFTVTTGQGVTRYRVLDVRRPGDLNPPVKPGQGRLILATADGPPFAPTGMVWVDADAITAPKPAPAMVISASEISPSELALGTQPGDWLPLVLWGEGLLVAALAVTWLRTQWSSWQTWMVAIPLLGYLGLEVADQVARLLPNVM
jgi:sortase A